MAADSELDEDTPLTFSDLGLDERLLKTLREVGYETPSPIQAQAPSPVAGGA